MVCVTGRCREVQRLQQESEELRTLQSHIQAAQVRFTNFMCQSTCQPGS